MAGFSAITYAAAKSYVKASLRGLGAIAGKNCTIKETLPIKDGTNIVFEWTDNSGNSKTTSVIVKDGKDGIGILNVYLDTNNDLYIDLSDGTSIKAGHLTASGNLNPSNYYTKSEVENLVNKKIADAVLGGGIEYAEENDIDFLF